MAVKFSNPICLILVLSLSILGSTAEVIAETKLNQDSKELVITQQNKDDDEKEEKEEKEEEDIELKGIPKGINKIAEKITVRIDSPNGNGSGVIFAQDGDRYYVVTAKHVIAKKQDYQIVTEDEEVYEIKSAEIKKLGDADLAILTFTSDKNYKVAAFSDYDLGLNKEFWVFVYGWARSESKPETLLTVGKVVGKETGLFLVKDDLSLTQTNGYELIYTNLSERGMSGGAVLDTSGRVIGIHTSAEGERYRLTNKLQLGFSLGIPIATFLESQKLKLLTESRNIEINTIKERADIVPFFRPNLSRENLDSITTSRLKSPSTSDSETEWVNYGNQLWRLSRYTEAVKAFNQAIAKKTNFHQAYYGKGLALYDIGKYQKANKAFKKAIDLKSDFYPAWYRRTLSLLNLKKYSQALKVVEKTITLKPENTALYALRGEALQNLAQYHDAIDSYNLAITEDRNPLILTSSPELK